MRNGICLLVSALCALVSSLTQAQATPNRAIQRALEATVMIRQDGVQEQFLGSGFYFGADGFILSNAHVIGAKTTVILEFRDGARHSARVLARDVKRDIAVLQSDIIRPGLVPARAEPEIGQPVFAIGAPLGVGFTVTGGVVSADPRQIDPTIPLRFLQHDAAINPGSSGGPVIDAAGGLLGMNSRIADGSRMFVGISYAIRGRDLERLVPDLLAGVLRPVPKLDMAARPVTKPIAKALGIPNTGLLIEDVDPNGTAARAGILPGDVLIAVAGVALRAPHDLIYALETHSAGTELEVLRKGTGKTLWLAFNQDPLHPAHPAPNPRNSTAPLRWSQLSVKTQGGTVIDLPKTGPAALAGLTLGDQVLAVNGLQLDTDPVAAAFDAALILRIERDGRRLHLIVDPFADTTTRPSVIRGNALDLSVRRF